MLDDGQPERPAGMTSAGTWVRADRYWNYAHEDHAAWLRLDGRYLPWAAPSPAALSRVQHAFAYLERFDVYGYVADEAIEAVRIESK